MEGKIARHLRVITLLVLFLLAACNSPADPTTGPAVTYISQPATNTPIAPSLTQTPADVPIVNGTVTPCAPPEGWQSYAVQAGDTLFGIASAAETTVSAIMEANCLTTMNLLKVGQTLYVPPTNSLP
jgi:LysM repeat protein